MARRARLADAARQPLDAAEAPASSTTIRGSRVDRATRPTRRPAPRRSTAWCGFKNLAVGVLPLHDDGTVTLVGQYRFSAGDYSWEIPEGGAPLDEDPLDGAKRELREEAGLAAADWREVLRLQLSNSVTDELAIGYLATG